MKIVQNYLIAVSFLQVDRNGAFKVVNMSSLKIVLVFMCYTESLHPKNLQDLAEKNQFV